MKWKPINTAPMDGTTILLFTKSNGVCEAFFSAGQWSEDTHVSPAEYYGDVWVCCDDAFQIEVELNSLECGGNHHGQATHWMPLPEPPQEKEDEKELPVRRWRVSSTGWEKEI